MSNNDEIFARVSAVVRETFHVDSRTAVTRETTSADIDGWDSLAHSILMMGIEDEFSVDLPSDKMFGLGNVGELTDLVRDAMSRG
jgi:acyl carrier protein